MITLLFGPFGSGKTTQIAHQIKKDLEAGIHTFLIVPEQETVQTEHTMLELLPPSAQIQLEVLNFSRLYNRVCREYGGLSYRYITKPIRHLLMWQNIKELAPLLEAYADVNSVDTSFAEVMLSAVDECKACGISPSELEKTALKLSSDMPLARRLRDLALIYASYDRLVSENYTEAADDLSRLYELLKKENFFSHTHVYVDSFTSFTAVEHRILECIFAQANEVTVTVPLSNASCKDISTAGIRASMEKLIVSANRHGGYKERILQGNRRATFPMLSYLAENIWRLDVSAKEDAMLNDGSIHMEICDTPYAEAEAAAAHILMLLQKGERCRDIAVLMRDPEQYRGILEPALDKCGIPYFFSEKNDLCSLPPIKLLLSALQIKQYHWQKSDIISHVKTGMYDFSTRSVDLFEEYINTWNLHGTRFYEADWTMNPDGFAETISPRGQDILTAANEIRRCLTEILETFFILLDAAEHVADMCRAVYRYLTDIGLEDRLYALAKAEADRGNYKEARELQALYGVMLNTLADIAEAMPEEKLTTEEFSSILKTVFRETDIGTIPTSVDEVTVGSAAMLRVSNPKHVFVLGLCEGIFPAAVTDHGIFNTVDRDLLSELGMELSSHADIRSSDELMYVQRAFAAPSCGLWLFTSVAELNGKSLSPSLPFTRVCALFPSLRPHRYAGNDLHYLAGGATSAVSHLRALEGTSEGLSLRHALSEHMPFLKTMSAASASDPICRVDANISAKTMGDRIRFSSSRFESYVSCPFQYYCNYVLGLREKQQANFRTSHMGTFIHYILEQLLRFATESDENGKLPDDEILIQKAEETVEQYIHRICPDELKQSKRLRHLYTRLKRLSLLMVRNIVEEFSHSEFRPVFFELSTNGRDGNPPPMEFVLEDGCHVSFAGIIDRVDLLRKDGEVYIRIVDYKTGTKDFSLEDIGHGINIQMLLYLFTLCRSENSDFARSLGLEEGQAPTPAGIVYLSANIPVVKADNYESEDEILEQAADSLKRSGLLLGEEDILRAMNSDFSPKFLAGIRKNKEDLLVGKAMTDREGFAALYKQIQDTVETVTKKMRQGIADAAPISYHAKDPCSYCKMRPICRKADQ